MAISKKPAKTADSFLSNLVAPAQRALTNAGITTLKNLSSFSEKEIMELHGMGKTTIPKLTAALKDAGLSFKKEKLLGKTTKASEPAKVNAYMKTLQHPLKDVVEALRQIILKTDKEIGEDIFWNAPAFLYSGEMRPFNPKEYKRFMVVFNLFKKDCIRLIFLHGDRVKDETGLLEGDHKDGRRIAMFYDLKDVKAKEATLKKIIKTWLKLLDK